MFIVGLDRGTGPFAGLVKSWRSIDSELESQPRVRSTKVTCTFCRRHTVVGSKLSQLPTAKQLLCSTHMACVSAYR